MKKIYYKDKYGRRVVKKQGFSWPVFLILGFFGILPGLIYLIVKVFLMILRKIFRRRKRR